MSTGARALHCLNYAAMYSYYARTLAGSTLVLHNHYRAIFEVVCTSHSDLKHIFTTYFQHSRHHCMLTFLQTSTLMAIILRKPVLLKYKIRIPQNCVMSFHRGLDNVEEFDEVNGKDCA